MNSLLSKLIPAAMAQTMDCGGSATPLSPHVLTMDCGAAPQTMDCGGSATPLSPHPQTMDCGGSATPLSPRPLSPRPSRLPVLKFKYVIFIVQGIETFSLVPEFAQHSDAINLAAKRPISAGFLSRAEDGSISVYGESTSLKLKSRPQDAEIIRDTFLMHGL